MHKSFFKFTQGFFRSSLLRLSKPKVITSLVFSTSLIYLNNPYSPFSSLKSYTQEEEEDTVEVETINASEVSEGQMKVFQIGPTEEDAILIYRYDGKFYATGRKCPHLHAPLEKGVVFDDKVYCPWHGSAFSIINGKPDQGPVFNDLPAYQAREENGKIIVTMPRKLQISVEPHMAKRFRAEFRKIVILGGGPAALSAVETLRRSGFSGEIILITNEPDLPYDRTTLSKNVFNNDVNKIALRDQSFFDKHTVTVMKDTHVKYINVEKGLLEIEGKDNIKYSKLLIATGGRPKVPPVAGTGLKNVKKLRTYQDLEEIKELAKESKRIVIIGGSFIGMELASAIKKEMKDKIDVVICDRRNSPLNRALGEDVGNALRAVHELNGVKFYLHRQVKAIEGAGVVKSVVLDDGTEFDADMVILGTGIKPNVDLVEHSLRISDDGGIYTDVFLQSSVSDIYAAGDVASYPYWYTGNRVRIEHYNEAIQQGQIAAYNMLDKKIPHNSIPFFWTRQYDMTLRYVGNGKDYDDIYIDGDTKGLKFVAYYGKDNRVVAAASIGVDPAVMIISQAMQANLMPTMEEIKTGKISVEDIKDRVKKKKGCGKCKRTAYETREVPKQIK